MCLFFSMGYLWYFQSLNVVTQTRKMRYIPKLSCKENLFLFLILSTNEVFY